MEGGIVKRVSSVPIVSCYFIKVYFFCNEFEVFGSEFADKFVIFTGPGDKTFDVILQVFKYKGGIYHWGRAGHVGGCLDFMRVVGFFIILSLLVESLQEYTAKSVPPLEHLKIWGLAGWLETWWGVFVKRVLGRGHLCSGECVVVRTDNVTD